MSETRACTVCGRVATTYAATMLYFCPDHAVPRAEPIPEDEDAPSPLDALLAQVRLDAPVYDPGLDRSTTREEYSQGRAVARLTSCLNESEREGRRRAVAGALARARRYANWIVDQDAPPLGHVKGHARRIVRILDHVLGGAPLDEDEVDAGIEELRRSACSTYTPDETDRRLASTLSPLEREGFYRRRAARQTPVLGAAGEILGWRDPS